MNGKIYVVEPNVIVPLLSQSNSICSFAMKNHWVKRKTTQKSSPFASKCSGKCTFSDCPVEFTISIRSFDYDNPPHELDAIINGRLNHDGVK